MSELARREREVGRGGEHGRRLVSQSHNQPPSASKKAPQTTTKTKQSEAFSVVVVAQCNVRQFSGMLKQLRCCSVAIAVAVAVAFAFCSHLHSPLCSHLRSPLRSALRSHAACCIQSLSHSLFASLTLPARCRRSAVCVSGSRSIPFCAASLLLLLFLLLFVRLFLFAFSLHIYGALLSKRSAAAAPSASQSKSQSPLWCFTLCSRRDVVIAIKCQCTCSCFSLVCVVTVYAYVCV